MVSRRAPASMAFSTSSFTTEAGRSTTSPAAIWFARSGGRRVMLPMRGVSIAHLHSERRLRRREPGHGDSIRRGADVVEADPVEEMHRRRVAAVLAADANLQVGPALAAA